MVPDDRVLLAREGDKIIGILRLSPLADALCLRGMQIRADRRRMGLGSAMLLQLIKQMDRPCYCLPYAHLLDFYAQAGFKPVHRADLPTLLAERYNNYLSRGLHVSAMARD
ncbi:GNAT family N-acetyltransferase [Jeongeupia wiesaeckerbachi]|uniref:GNAT family N-acetyltransferase n=1 Tax=Jeongeupia wiesaeckerbachi TaxID=3051218 RepID=UPI003D800350